MSKRICFIIALLILCSTCSMAQKRRTTRKKTKSKQEVVDEQFQERLRLMAASTQDVIVVDSIVVGKKNFLAHYKISSDAGTIATYEDYFGTKMSDSSFVYVNEMGDKCYYSHGDTTHIELYTRDLVGGEWTSAIKVAGLDSSVYKKQNFPFMMPDGVTFYLAATGKESIGGYDIFVTRYDSEDNRFFTPENIGMPFNSTANDYMYVVDEINQIGWFASDRNQPKDSVCLYIFIPSETRTIYSNTKYTEEQLMSLGKLQSIAATWRDGTARTQALKRLANTTTESDDSKTGTSIYFVINNTTIYTSLSDFTVDINKEKYLQLLELKQLFKKQNSSLNKARNYFSRATEEEKKQLTTEILNGERNAENIENNISDLEKEIRNSENEKRNQ